MGLKVAKGGKGKVVYQSIYSKQNFIRAINKSSIELIAILQQILW